MMTLHSTKDVMKSGLRASTRAKLLKKCLFYKFAHVYAHNYKPKTAA